MPKVISSVKALLKYNKRFLFLKERLHKADIWDLPGGKIKYGETPEKTLIREVKEEIDIGVEIVKSVGVWWFFSKNNKHQVICHTFLCKPKGRVKIDFSKNPANENFIDYKWLTLKKALAKEEMCLTKSLKKLLMNLAV